MAGRQQWLDTGLIILGDLGARAITIERLADTLGLTKGSFYHHFKGMPGYKAEFLAFYEAHYTTRYIEQVESSRARDPGGSPEDALRSLVRAVRSDTSDWRTEVGLRAWAQQDADVRAVQQRIDATRQDYLFSLWSDFVDDPARAEQLARLCYLALIGAGHVLPPADPGEIERLYDGLIALTAGPHEIVRRVSG